MKQEMKTIILLTGGFSFIFLTAEAQKDTVRTVMPIKPVINTIDPKGIKLPVFEKPPATDPIKKSDADKFTIYVKWDATGSNNGTSWRDAYTSLQNAMGAAVAGNTIWVARGTYKPTTTLDRNANFRLKNNVSMYGGFSGGESRYSDRRILIHPTILDGDIGMVGNFTDNSYNLVYAKGINASTIISGFIIQNANADQVTQARVDSSGGGIYVEGSLAGTNPVFNHCIIRNNRATWGGGVMITCNQVDPDYGGGNPVFESCTFTNNNGANLGGAVYIDSYWQEFNPRFTGCTLDSNSSGKGGAVYHDVTKANSNPVYQNCLFSENRASLEGAAIYQVLGTDMIRLTSGEATPVYENCTFRNNQNAFSGVGTMFSIHAAGRSYTVEIKNCIFEYQGSATTTSVFSHVGGAFHIVSRARGNIYLKVSNSIFNKLKCGGNGGVIYNYSIGGTNITADFTNCLFSENYGCNGGVLYATTEDPGSTNTTNFYNSIFYYNYFQRAGIDGSCGRGEDIYLSTAGSSATMVNCLSNKGSCDIMKYGIGSLSCTGTIFATDPMFTSFATGNFVPQAGSPLINAGNDTYVSTILRDFLGNTRRQGAHVDIGPYEVR